MERQVLTLKVGLETEVSKRMIKHLKEGKFKAQGSIQGDQLRVSGKSRDELQAAITALRAHDFGLPIQFNNFRD
jgi:uncharacterized protein YajQ (UPF0234 family)